MAHQRVVIAILLFVVPGGLFAQTHAGPEAVLEALYASHQPWAKKDVLRDGHMSDFFDETIVRLVRADQDCRAPDWGVGNLDFDPILDAQDWGDSGIGDLRIKRISGGVANRYEVSFLLFPGVSKVRTRLIYRMVESKGRWRVADIQYQRSTLLRVLAPPCK